MAQAPWLGHETPIAAFSRLAAAALLRTGADSATDPPDSRSCHGASLEYCLPSAASLRLRPRISVSNERRWRGRVSVVAPSSLEQNSPGRARLMYCRSGSGHARHPLVHAGGWVPARAAIPRLAEEDRTSWLQCAISLMLRTAMSVGQSERTTPSHARPRFLRIASSTVVDNWMSSGWRASRNPPRPRRSSLPPRCRMRRAMV